MTAAQLRSPYPEAGIFAALPGAQPPLPDLPLEAKMMVKIIHGEGTIPLSKEEEDAVVVVTMEKTCVMQRIFLKESEDNTQRAVYHQKMIHLENASH